MLFMKTEDEEKQQRLRTEAMKFIGTFSGNDPERAETAEQNVKKVLRQQAGRNYRVRSGPRKVE